MPARTNPIPTGAIPADAARLARTYPGGVPVLVDEAAGVTLRALAPRDLPGVVEQCRDPDSIRYTTVPVPAGGYALPDAEEFAALVAEGWRSGRSGVWAIEERRRPGAFAGSIDLSLHGHELAEVGFGLHPAARGHHVMSSALRLVRDFAFDAVGLQAVRWRTVVGNWASRKVAASAGWRCEATVRRSLVHRGELLDGWAATLLAGDPRTPVAWLDPPVLSGATLRLRPFTDADADRVVEACTDPRTQRWLVSLPRPYTRTHALAYLESTRESAARGTGLVWCVADPRDDRCLGSVSLDGLGGYARRAEIGYWAHPDARARGLLTTAVRTVTAWAEAGDVADSVMIRAAATNTASRRVAEQAGYGLVGVQPRCEPLGDGTLADLVLYARP